MNPLAENQFADITVLENELTLDNEGWALLAPFGEHIKERDALVDGKIVRQRFVQILDEQSVDAVVANEKGEGLFAKIKRALVKRPIYNGHPDLKLYSPETVAAANEKLSAIGLNYGCRRTERGLEFQPVLVPEGAVAVENDGCKYPSALFLLEKTGVVRPDGAIEVRPFRLASIGLTRHPNISGVDSLANARQPTTAEQKPNTEPPMKLIAGWLLAQGVALANTETPTETQVLEAIQKLHTSRAADVTALANEKSTLSGIITALENEKTTLATERDGLKTKLTEAQTALGNEQTAFKAERKARAEACVDLNISNGRLSVAERDTEINRLIALDNTAFMAELDKLEKRPVKHPVKTVMESQKQIAGATNAALALSNAMEPHIKAGKTKAQALDLVMKDQPALHAAYLKEGAGAL